jgi:glycosyltransferase involved in cell wall biosynthesis
VAFVPSSYGFLSTYPPTQCGLATFTSALLRSLTRAGCRVSAGVVRVVDAPIKSGVPEVVAHLHTRSSRSYTAAAEALNRFDVAVVQHEYGIYGGQDGDQVLSVLDRVRVPIVAVAHTVLAHPTLHQRQVLEQVADTASAVVTMSHAARNRLVGCYAVDADKVVVIPHGAPVRSSRDRALAGERPLVLTWGLLGPGKGIEWAIDGMQEVSLVSPSPAYIIAGQTHPRVRRQQGESYRLQLGQRARAVGVAKHVRFEGSYLDEVSLTRLVRRADVVLLPYDSRDQVTSGVLVEAVAAGIPVVATAFPHAVELLGSGAGLLVPHCDGAAFGAALHRVLTEPGLAQQMSTEAFRLAPALLWPAVADRYRSLAAELLANRTAVLG